MISIRGYCFIVIHHEEHCAGSSAGDGHFVIDRGCTNDDGIGAAKHVILHGDCAIGVRIGAGEYVVVDGGYASPPWQSQESFLKLVLTTRDLKPRLRLLSEIVHCIAAPLDD